MTITDGWTEGPERSYWYPLKGRGDNAYHVILADGQEFTCYIDPAKGIDAMIRDLIDPPELPGDAAPPRDLAAELDALKARIAALEATRIDIRK
jgi:hypothetical protein